VADETLHQRMPFSKSLAPRLPASGAAQLQVDMKDWIKTREGTALAASPRAGRNPEDQELENPSVVRGDTL
jgi:hypothetical protein